MSYVTVGVDVDVYLDDIDTKSMVDELEARGIRCDKNCEDNPSLNDQLTRRILDLVEASDQFNIVELQDIRKFLR